MKMIDLVLDGNENWIFFLLFIFIFFLISFSYFLFKKKYFSNELNRRLIHTIMGLLLSLSPLIFTNNIFPIMLAGIFFLINSIGFNSKLFLGIHSQKRISYGTIYFPLSYLIISWLFWDYNDFITLSFLILAFSDSFASQVGSTVKSPKKFIVWYDEKSIQGTITFFLVTFLIVFLGSKILLSYSIFTRLGLAFLVSVFGTFAEITSKKGTDNLSIPLVTILIMIGYDSTISDGSINTNILIISIMSIVLFMTYYFNSLSLSGYFGSLFMGTMIVFFGSILKLCLLAIFFILSSSLSKLIKGRSLEKKSSPPKRDIVQVFCNGGIALIICLYDYFITDYNYIYIYAASIATAMSDTWGTEFGKLSQSKPISIITRKPINHGMSGGITFIGTLGSLLGSCVLGFILWALSPTSDIIIYCVIASGFSGAIFDSVLGATIQAKYIIKQNEVTEIKSKDSLLISGYKSINNNTVNLMATIIGPIMMLIFMKLYSIISI